MRVSKVLIMSLRPYLKSKNISPIALRNLKTKRASKLCLKLKVKIRLREEVLHQGSFSIELVKMIDNIIKQ